MSEQQKTIAIRVSPDLRAQLDAVIAVTKQTVNDAGTEALQEWINSKLQDPRVWEQMRKSYEADEQALRDRRLAMERLFDETGAPAPSSAGASSAHDTGEEGTGDIPAPAPTPTPDKPGPKPEDKPATSPAGKPAPRRSSKPS
jgi:hypothetical protein